MLAFDILSFDGDGYIDASAFDRHQRACVEQAVTPLGTEAERSRTVIEAAERFVAEGGRWAPSRPLARRIDQAALGRGKSE